MSVTISANSNATLPFTLNIQGHDAQAVPWSRSYTFTSLITSHTVDEIEAQQLADVYTKGNSGLPVQAIQIGGVTSVTGGGGLNSSLQGTAAGTVTVVGGLSLNTIVSNAGISTTPVFTEPCTAADPLTSGKWHGAAVQTDANTGLAIEYPDSLTSPNVMDTTPTARWARTGSGGASGGSRWRFYAPAGDNIYSDGGRGRASIDYPKYNPGSPPAHIGPEGNSDSIGLFYEGRRAVTAFSVRLPSGLGYSLDPPIDWRVITQWKRNEWYTVTDPQDSPVLALEQKNGYWYMIHEGASLPDGAVWAMDATGAIGQWINFAFDITFSQSTGTARMRVYADTNNDGNYEYDSGNLTGFRTLSPGSNVDESGLSAPVAARFPGNGIESMFSVGMYEADGGDYVDFSDIAIYGNTP